MSLRRVDWQSFSTNFFVIFSPGALEGAPLTYVATARVPSAAETAVQDAVVRAFPNVTAIPVRDVLERVGRIMDQVAVAVRVVAAFVIGAGLVVMASALATTRYQRLYESALLRTLGATRTVVARTFAVEYACLGAAAGVGGSALALLLAWIVLRFVLDVPWTFGRHPRPRRHAPSSSPRPSASWGPSASSAAPALLGASIHPGSAARLFRRLEIACRGTARSAPPARVLDGGLPGC
jgi:predicted lysophospholipase L1 biosynthesis ABC-type transport system permease subunit